MKEIGLGQKQTLRNMIKRVTKTFPEGLAGSVEGKINNLNDK
jgi:hypothetical protein